MLSTLRISRTAVFRAAHAVRAASVIPMGPGAARDSNPPQRANPAAPERPTPENLDASPIDHWGETGLSANENDAAEVLERRGRSVMRKELHEEAQFYPDTVITDPFEAVRWEKEASFSKSTSTSTKSEVENRTQGKTAVVEDPLLGRFDSSRPEGRNMEKASQKNPLMEDLLGGTEKRKNFSR